MWADHTLQNLSDQEEYSRSELSQVFLRKNPDLTDSAFRWILYNLLHYTIAFYSTSEEAFAHSS